MSSSIYGKASHDPSGTRNWSFPWLLQLTRIKRHGIRRKSHTSSINLAINQTMCQNSLYNKSASSLSSVANFYSINLADSLSQTYNNNTKTCKFAIPWDSTSRKSPCRSVPLSRSTISSSLAGSSFPTTSVQIFSYQQLLIPWVKYISFSSSRKTILVPLPLLYTGWNVLICK